MTDFESLFNQPSPVFCPACFVGKSASQRIVEVDYSHVSQADLIEAHEIVVGAISFVEDMLLKRGLITPEQIAADNQDLLDNINWRRQADGNGWLGSL